MVSLEKDSFSSHHCRVWALRHSRCRTALGKQVMQLLKLALYSCLKWGNSLTFDFIAKHFDEWCIFTLFLEKWVKFTLTSLPNISISVLKKILSASEVTSVLIVRLLENHYSGLNKWSSVEMTKTGDHSAEFCHYFSAMQNLCADDIGLQVVLVNFIYSSTLLWIWNEIWAVGMNIKRMLTELVKRPSFEVPCLGLLQLACSVIILLFWF